jgi:type II secretory pathway component PulJ
MDRGNSFRAAFLHETGAKATAYRVWSLSIIMSALALIIWAVFAYNARSSAAVQNQLYDHIAQLTVSYVQLVADHEESTAYLTEARKALSTLGERLERATAECAQGNEQTAAPGYTGGISDRPSAEAHTTETGSIQTFNQSRKHALSPATRRTSSDPSKRQLP